jgi:hypothetical protein
MPTLQDLSELLSERAETAAPDRHTVVATFEGAVAARRSPARRATPWLAAAAVVALTAGVVALAGSANRGGNPAASVAMPPQGHVVWQFEIGKVSGWTVERTYSSWWSNSTGTAGGWGQGADLTPTSGRARVTYGREPAAEPYPGNFSTAHPITVAGRPGLWMPGHRVNTADLVARVRKHPWEAVAASGDPQPALRWKNADGTWNIIMGTVGFRPDTYDFNNVVAKRELLRFAAAVRSPTSRQYVTAPLHVTVGNRFRRTDVSSVRGIWCVGFTTLHSLRTPNLPQTLVTVCRAPANRLHDSFLPMTSKRDDAMSQRRLLPDGTALVIGVYNHVLNPAATRRVLDSTKISSSMTDQRTWLPV